MTDKEMFAAVRALPHMEAKKVDGEYRVAYRLAAIRRAKPEWSRDRAKSHAEKTSYYTEDRADALGTARELSAHMVRMYERLKVPA